MNTETLTINQIENGYEIIVEHDQTGSAYGIILSKNLFDQLQKWHNA